MTRVVLVLALVLGCGDTESRPPPEKAIVSKFADELRSSDRHELVQIRGTVLAIEAFERFGERHVQFRLRHGDVDIFVAHKGAIPDLLRNGIEAKVLGRWVPTEEVRDALVKEGFKALILKDDVFLSREIVVLPPEF
jgi:hypothetical protein